MRKKEDEKQVIEIKEEIQVGDTILEAGDKVEVLNESFGPSGMREFDDLVNSSSLSYKDITRYILGEASDQTTQEMLRLAKEIVES